MFYKCLNNDEINYLKDLKIKYSEGDEKEYEAELEKYLDKINYSERLSDYIQDKWYIKIFRWIFNKKK